MRARSGFSPQTLISNTGPWRCAQEGVVSSGNSLDYCQQDWDQMHASEAAVKEMEAAGIA